MRDLLCKKLELQIDEPFNFKTSEKVNAFEVEYIKMFEQGEEEKKIFRFKFKKPKRYFILKVKTPFQWKEKIIDYLIVRARYINESIEDLLGWKNEVTVNIDRILNKDIINAEKFTWDDLDYSFIGTLKVKGKLK